jgi:hypothetical protein
MHSRLLCGVRSSVCIVCRTGVYIIGTTQLPVEWKSCYCEMTGHLVWRSDLSKCASWGGDRTIIEWSRKGVEGCSLKSMKQWG